jgi:hypothetical protein
MYGKKQGRGQTHLVRSAMELVELIAPIVLDKVSTNLPVSLFLFILI